MVRKQFGVRFYRRFNERESKTLPMHIREKIESWPKSRLIHEYGEEEQKKAATITAQQQSK
jgi:hypothetical protein